MEVFHLKFSALSLTSKFKARTLPLQSYSRNTPKKPSDVASDNSTVENEEDDTSTGDVEYMDLDPEYVAGSDSDLDDNPLENDELDSETANDSVFHHVNTNFVTRSGRKVGIPKEYMYGQLVSDKGDYSFTFHY